MYTRTWSRSEVFGAPVLQSTTRPPSPSIATTSGLPARTTPSLPVIWNRHWLSTRTSQPWARRDAATSRTISVCCAVQAATSKSPGRFS